MFGLWQVMICFGTYQCVEESWDGLVYHVVHSKAWVHFDSKWLKFAPKNESKLSPPKL
jgi:hypothetical protein